MAIENETPVAAFGSDQNYVELLAQAGETALKNLSDSQDAFLQAAQAASESLPKAPEVKIPVDPKLPTARQLLELNFDLAGKLLANQKAYAEKFLALVGA